MTTYPPLVDVEALLVALLGAAGINARTRVPNPRSAGMVRVRRSGGGRESGISDRPQVLVECWHSTTKTADDLAIECERALYSARNQVFQGWRIKAVETAGFVDNFDAAAPEMSRRQFTASLLLRLAA